MGLSSGPFSNPRRYFHRLTVEQENENRTRFERRLDRRGAGLGCTNEME